MAYSYVPAVGVALPAMYDEVAAADADIERIEAGLHSQGSVDVRSYYAALLQRLLHETVERHSSGRTLGIFIAERVVELQPEEAELVLKDTIVTLDNSVLMPYPGLDEAEVASAKNTVAGAAHMARVQLATLLEQQSRYADAAQVLSSTTYYTAPSPERAELLIRLISLYTDAGELMLASKCIEEVNGLRYAVTHDLEKSYNVTAARYNARKGDYLAASRMFEFCSRSPPPAGAQGGGDAAAHELFEKAIFCALLARASSARDERLRGYAADPRMGKGGFFCSLLERMTQGRLLAAEDVDTFCDYLAPYLAESRDEHGLNKAESAVVQHNLLVISQYFSSISLQNLAARYLHLSDRAGRTAAERAEGCVADMIYRRQFVGHIDQVSGTVYFDAPPGEFANGVASRGVKAHDSAMASLNADVERIAGMVMQECPALQPTGCS